MLLSQPLLEQPEVEFHWLRLGRCNQLEALSRKGGPWKNIEFPSLAAAIKHPTEGWVMFDTGYSQHFFDATARMPERLYRTLLPVHLDTSIAAELGRIGAEPEEVRRVVVSHFHGDHVAGLRDLPNARISAGRAGLEQVTSLRGISAVRHGLLPAMLPEDVKSRFDAVEERTAVSVDGLTGWDLVGDRSLVAVDLPGHMPGHIGLLLTVADGPHGGGQVLLAGDAAWSSRAIRDLQPPARPVAAMFDDPGAARSTLSSLHRLDADHADLTILPAHCVEAFREWNAGA
ncbi:MBL fold metallo-hydrolase [Nocardioides speluncae]|uniref:MBL fold metallo-hydrolase n=1 Tax=Nocardioides speluncae TaxID=2670337 RepID=UPI000D699308|nr:MBL fold metallo-hydrolase [Nocardioides speluncae]